LHVYSGNIAKSYVGSTNTIAVTSTGWFNTGDVVKLTHNGTLELVGRNGDFIKNARSEIVYFKEIEAILLPNKFIKDLCTFSFIEDETEKLALLIVVNSLGTTHKNIVEEISHELSNCLGPNKAMIKIKVVDEIPRKINGKFDKNELLKYI
jgi:long-subunit acyl-CoA synthetase (AMP-forming)